MFHRERKYLPRPLEGEGRGEGVGCVKSKPISNLPVSWIALLAALLFFSPDLRADSEHLIWHKDKDTVDADIKSSDVLQTLETVARATGWKVYLDPKAIHPVSVKFKGLATGDALHTLLGDLNFALVPQTNGPSRLYVFRTSREQATRLVAVVKPAKPIPNELIVTLKPDSKEKIEDLAKALGAKIIGRMDGQHSYLLQFPDDATTQLASDSLAKNPDVAGTDVNFPINPPPTLAGADSAAPNLQLKPKSGDGSKLIVGLIDTAYQSLGENLDAFMLPQIHVAGDAQIPADQLTHGTAMAETIMDSLQQKTGGSTSVKILPVDVYGGNETTSTFDVANGIVQAVNNGANFINLSLGGTSDSQFLHDTIIQVSKQGIPIYAAAGNDPVTTPTYPAAYPEVVAITATDRSGQIAPYANRGSFIDMTAPGDNIVAFGGQNYVVEGTSTSTAFVTGAAAGLVDAAHATADQATALLQKNLPRSSVPKQ